MKELPTMLLGRLLVLHHARRYHNCLTLLAKPATHLLLCFAQWRGRVEEERAGAHLHFLSLLKWLVVLLLLLLGQVLLGGLYNGGLWTCHSI